jgi:hypothetical protein
MRLFRTVLLLACAVGSPGICLAQVPFPLTVSGNKASANVELPGGLGIELTIEFEEVVGLNPGALAVSARVVSPLELGLVGNLLGVSTVTVPSALPVMIRIEPTPWSALSFSGVTTVTLYTHNLDLDLLAPLGLFSSSNGEPFREITRGVTMGSYRVDGSGGGFSDFIIGRDTRSINTIIAEKFSKLQGLLSDESGSMPAAVYTLLQQHYTQARTYFLLGQVQAAIGQMTAFGAIVRAHSGGDIPDVWRANDSRPNVAGLLRAAADTLKFSLNVKANQSP